MYSVNDKKAAIFEVQRFLFVISQKNDISHLSVDGFYSTETENSVRDFQKLHSLDVNGTVNRETFDMIYSEYKKIKKYDALSCRAEDIDAFPLKMGDSGNNVSDLNTLIRRLSQFYRDLPKPYGNFYSKDTEKAIRLLQRYARNEENGKTSLEFFYILKKELLNRQKF